MYMQHHACTTGCSENMGEGIFILHSNPRKSLPTVKMRYGVAETCEIGSRLQWPSVPHVVLCPHWCNTKDMYFFTSGFQDSIQTLYTEAALSTNLTSGNAITKSPA